MESSHWRSPCRSFLFLDSLLVVQPFIVLMSSLSYILTPGMSSNFWNQNQSIIQHCSDVLGQACWRSSTPRSTDTSRIPPLFSHIIPSCHFICPLLFQLSILPIQWNCQLNIISKYALPNRLCSVWTNQVHYLLNSYNLKALLLSGRYNKHQSRKSPKHILCKWLSFLKPMPAVQTVISTW